jgi:hypothetical protein
VQGIPEKSLDMGAESGIVTIRPGKDLRLAAKVDMDEDAAKHTTSFEFVITANSKSDEKIVRKVNFYSENQDHHKDEH